MFAAIVADGEVMQSVWVGPAFEIVGKSFTINATVAVEARQGGLEMVHAKIFMPKPKPVIVEFSWVGFEIVPLPETRVHKPVPTVGVLAAIMVVLEEIQRVCVTPALAVVGTLLTVIATVDVVGAHGGLEIVQAKTFTPRFMPVTDVVGDSEFVMVPLPDIRVQTPLPTIAVLAFMKAFGLVMHTV